MGFFDRLGNLVKGGVAIARNPEPDAARAAREQALAADLERPLPSDAARAELDRLRAQLGGAPAPAPVGAPNPDPLAGELARLQRAYEEGVITRTELDRKRAEAVARLDRDGDGAAREIKRTL